MITVVGATSAGGDSTSLAISKPSGTAEGDYLVASIAFDREGGTPTITPPSGWTAIQSEYSSASLWTGYKLAGASEGSSYTWSFSGDSRAIAGGIVTIRGVNAPSQSSERVNSATKNHTASGVTVTSANALLVFGVAIGGWQQNFDPPSGWTERVDQGGGWTSVGMFTKEVTSGATGDPIATTYYDADDVCHLVALPAQIYATAEVSTGTGAAQSASVKISPRNTGVGAGTGTAHNVTAKITVNAGSAAGAGAAPDAHAKVGAAASVATATGAAAAPSAKVAASAGSAAGTGASSNGSITYDIEVAAECAQGAGEAHQPAVYLGALTVAITASHHSATTLSDSPSASTTLSDAHSGTCDTF